MMTLSDLMVQVNQIKENPVQFLLQRGLKLPNTVGNDPNAIIQHLMNTGQVSQNQYNNAVNMANQICAYANKK